MAAKNESLQRGLHTSMDSSMAPESSLVRARNARYRVGDPAVWQSEGRKPIGDPDDTGSHSSGNKLNFGQIAMAVWDPGTTVDGSTREDAQICYVDGQQKVLLTLPARDNYLDPSMSPGQVRTVTPPFGEFGVTPFSLVHTTGKYYLLDGRHNLEFLRDDDGQKLIRHGLPVAPKSWFEPSVGLGIGNVWQFGIKTGDGDDTVWDDDGWVFFWWTWYDSTNDVEGTALPEFAVPSSRQTGSPFTGHVAVSSSVAQSVNFSLNLQQFDRQPIEIPPTADQIRIYRSLIVAKTNAAEQFPPYNPFPFGHLYTTINTADVSGGATVTLNSASDVFGDIPQTRHDDDLLVLQPGFPRATFVAGGQPISFGRHGEPPTATTGDVFEDSLVLNDVTDKDIIRYSVSGEHRSFPPQFVIRLDSKLRDEVVCIRALGNTLGVFMTRAVFKVNWLPQDGDRQFQLGRVKDIVAEGRGAANQFCVTRVALPNLGTMLAAADRTGIYLTDLDTTIELTSHVDWSAIAPNPNALAGDAVLLNNFDEKRLEFWHADQGWYFHYDRAHFIEGQMAVTGPIQRPNKVAAIVSGATELGRSVVVSSDGTNLYYDGIGTDDDTTALGFEIKTRDIYPAGIGQEARSQDFYVSQKIGGLGGAKWLAQLEGHAATGNVAIHTSKLFEASTRKLQHIQGRVMFENYAIRIVADSGEFPIGVNFVGVHFEPLGDSDFGD